MPSTRYTVRLPPALETAVQEYLRTAGARTALWVPALGRLVLAVPHRGAQGAEIRMYAIP